MLVYIMCFRKQEDSLYSVPQANNGNVVLTLPIIIAKNRYASEHNPGSGGLISLVYLYSC